MGRKICILAPVHRFDDVRVFTKEAMSLSGDFDCVVLYAKIKMALENGNILVKPVPEFSNRIFRFIYLICLLKKALSEKADLYYLHNPDTLPLVFLLKLLGKKVVYDTHEDFSKRLMMRTWIPRILRSTICNVIFFTELLASRVADLFVVTQPGLIKKYSGNVLLIGNPPVSKSEDNLDFTSSISLDKDTFYLVYVGGINEYRGIDVAIDGLVNINNKFKCVLLLVGPCDPKYLRVLQKKDGWAYVDYRGELTQSEAFSFINAADVGVVTIKDYADHKYTSPNKLYEYMNFGKPFIASDFILWKEQLNDISAGCFVDPESEEEFVNTVVYLHSSDVLRKNMGDTGKNYVETVYNWEVEYIKLKVNIDKILLRTDKKTHN